MAGQLLEISKHENTLRATPSGLAGRRARIYQFPFKAPALPAQPSLTPRRKRLSNLRIHLAVEIAVGLFLWLAWFVLHLIR